MEWNWEKHTHRDIRKHIKRLNKGTVLLNSFPIVVIVMVQKYQSPVRVYKYPFELVMKVSVNAKGMQIAIYSSLILIASLKSDFVFIIIRMVGVLLC